MLSCMRRATEVPQGCRFEAVASDVSGWLSTEAAHRASRVFAAVGWLRPHDSAFACACSDLVYKAT